MTPLSPGVIFMVLLACGIRLERRIKKPMITNEVSAF